ncbi:hypothetical protein [Helicovermis profundi]|uniref:Uncharacterized protein n=1 Tax=Helicovermis profundi TaxID=3065157 RepID=A0AAU9E363_9FIRM|nr:hypothetical protein HLPR_12770 [Clostridia bacterium S502]
MQNKIYEMRKILFLLEQSILYCETDKFYKEIGKMETVIDDLKESFAKETNCSVEFKEVKNINKKILNTIEFVYKPITVLNVFEGNYLENFSNERTEQLSIARAINNHNEFWKQHTTIHGNIYGSVPIELISSESLEILYKLGWKKIKTNIIEIRGSKDSSQDIVDYCDKYLDYYIIVLEESTKTRLILEYLIK